jgi:hypothetical protein
MSKDGRVPSKKRCASLHFDLGHYNRTHQSFVVSGNRLRASKAWTLSQRVERAYFMGMATHFAADLVMHELVNVYAGSYHIQDDCWEMEHGLSQKPFNIRKTHSKVEHYWDTYVRCRYLGDWGMVWPARDEPDGPRMLGLPLVDTLARDAKEINPQVGAAIAEIFSKDDNLRHGVELAGPKCAVAKDRLKMYEVIMSPEYQDNERTEFESNCRYLLERPLIFPRIFCDRLLARDGIDFGSPAGYWPTWI